MKGTAKSKYVLRRVHIQTLTWGRDSNGLFDYESKNLHKKNFLARNTVQLIRRGNDCILMEEDFKIDVETTTSLAWLVEYEGGFQVKADQSSDKLWMVVPPMKTVKLGEGYQLSEGDVIRLGRVSFNIKQVSPTGEDRPAFEAKSKQTGPTFPSSMTPTEEKVPCRICLSDVQTEDDPLISPCKCSGTMRLIHLKCLREWLQSRLNIKHTGSIVSYYWKSLDCELCKENLPSKVVLKGVPVELVDIHKPDTPFIVLEDNMRDRDRETGLGIHVLSMPNGATINLGRGHESDIRIQDISVSRLHASIHLSESSFRLVDRKSKFGTLVLVKRGIALSPGINLSLQVSRTVVNLKVKRDLNIAAIFCRCCLKAPQIIPKVGEMTLAEKLYECNERSGQFDDASFSHLLVQQGNAVNEQNAHPELPVIPRLIAPDFVEGEERPTTRARTIGEGSQVFHGLEEAQLA